MGKFLDSTGITHLWEKAKSAFSLSGHKHTVSDITNIATVGKTGSYTDLSNKPTIPTNNNQLTNGAGYQTASDVTSAISSAVGKITSFDAQVVTSLPTTGAKGVIYLIADSHSDSNDSYDEYIWLEDKKVFEKVGNTDVDLSGYVPKSGATMTGALNFANGTANVVGDDVQIGDCNVAGMLGIQGKDGETGIALLKYGQAWGNNAGRATITYDGTNIIASHVIKGNITNDSDGNQINTTYLKKSGGTMTGQIESTSGGNWIADRNNAAVKNTNSTASPYKPVISSKTPSGNWTVGSWNNEYFYFNYTDDTTYSAGTNTSTIVILPNKAGTIALTSDIPTTLPANGGTASNVSGTVAVGHGGTGATTLASGQALIGNGTNAVTTRAIKDITTNSALGWTSGDNSLIDANTLAYWNGAYSGTSSSLKYCVKGAFGDIVTHNASEFITTHYSSKNVVGTTTATTNSTSALSNGNVYFNSVENGAVTSSHKILGSGATTVTTDTGANIIIASTDTKTTAGSGNSGLSNTKQYLIIAKDRIGSGANTYSDEKCYVYNNELFSLGSKVLTTANLAMAGDTDTWSEIYRPKIVTIGTDGVSEIGKYIDFHNSDGNIKDFNTRIQCNNAANGNTILLPSDSGNLVVYRSVTGSTTQPVYLASSGVLEACLTYAGGTAVTLNGDSASAKEASFYAPTTVGTSGQILISSGNGAPTWANDNQETWTFTLEDGSTVSKTVRLG